MNDVLGFAMDLIERNVQVAGNPNARSMIDVIRRNDSARGEQIARNICETYGVTPEEAVRRARGLFHI